MQLDALALDERDAFDLVFSTATFHWIHDHAKLFRVLFEALRSGGRLVAQCGGGANVARAHERAKKRMARPDFAPFFERFDAPWYFARADETRARLEAAGFVDVDAALVPAPARFEDRAAFREFAESVVLGLFTQKIHDDALRARFVDEITDEFALDDPPFVFDYVRLNIRARKPG